MIVIHSFSLNNLTRRTWEFYEDKFAIKTKSLSADYEVEWEYSKIKEIQHKKLANLSWLCVSGGVLGLFFLVQLLLHSLSINFLNNPMIEKAVVVLAILLLIPAFRKHELYSFLDADSYYLTNIQVNDKSKKLLLDAIKLIKQKTEVASETYLSDPLPSTSPIFEFQVFDFPDYLGKSTVRIYDDRLIDVERSLVEELRTVVKFEELSGKTTRARLGNKHWDSFAFTWLIFVILLGAIAVVFFPDRLYHNFLLIGLFLGAIFLAVLFYLLQYIKTEAVMFYDKKDIVVFWTRVNRDNREILNQIITFVQEKVQFNP
jgi:hypothetical protein